MIMAALSCSLCSRFSIRTIANLMMSAAEPWSGALMAVRSAYSDYRVLGEESRGGVAPPAEEVST